MTFLTNLTGRFAAAISALTLSLVLFRLLWGLVGGRYARLSSLLHRPAAIVAYAAARHITVVPEIDMPGHTNAALASYPELNCNDTATKVYTGTEVGFSTLCVNKDVTYKFIDDVVREYVTLKGAGGGSLKGLCPFHDEKTPSFNVNAARGYFHCFGCQESGDVFTFIRKIEGMSFVEAIEKLASKYNITLQYEEAGAVPDRQAGLKSRLIEAHRAAAAFYVTQLATPGAEAGQIGRAHV